MNGVKQGGILSPVLFTMYLDILLNQLQSCGLGCYIGQTFMGAFAYADDIILLSPTKQSMHGMLKLANMFSKQYNIKFGVGTKKDELYWLVLNYCSDNLVFKLVIEEPKEELKVVEEPKLSMLEQLEKQRREIETKMQDEIKKQEEEARRKQEEEEKKRLEEEEEKKSKEKE